MSGYHKVVWEDVEKIAERELPWEKLKDSTVLITGAAGFIAAYIVYTLLYRNDKFGDSIKVLAIVRNKDKARIRFADVWDRNDFNIIIQDVCTPIQYDFTIDYIIHAASPASTKAFSLDPVGTLKANILGTMNILELARHSNTKSVLFLSSGMVYGRFGGLDPINEKVFRPIDSMDSQNVYSEAKRAGEMLCISYREQYCVPVKVARLFYIYGPGENIDSGRSAVCFAYDIHKGHDIVLRSDGKAIRSYCYVSDTVDAALTILLKGENGKAYNVGNDIDVLTITEFAKKFIDSAKEKQLKLIYDKNNLNSSTKFIDCYKPDLSELYLLGWKPQTNIENGIRRVIESLG